MPATRREAPYLRKRITIPFQHAQVTASNTPIVVAKTLSRAYRIDRVQYLNVTGLAADPTNYFTVRILNGATVAAKWATLSTAEGALAPNTENDLVLQAAAALVVPASTAISLALVLAGTQTLPAGSGFIEATIL